jgi:uncharacterized repeat protein (TIGR01451 family)
MRKFSRKKWLNLILSFAVLLGTFGAPISAMAAPVNGWVFPVENETGAPLENGTISVYEKENMSTWEASSADDYQFDLSLIYTGFVEQGEAFVPNAYLLEGKEYEIVITGSTSQNKSIIYHDSFSPGHNVDLEFSSSHLIKREFTVSKEYDQYNLYLYFTEGDQELSWPTYLDYDLEQVATAYISSPSNFKVISDLYDDSSKSGYLFEKNIAPSTSSPLALDSDLIEIKAPEGFTNVKIYADHKRDNYSTAKPDTYFVTKGMSSIYVHYTIDQEGYLYNLNRYIDEPLNDTLLSQVGTEFVGAVRSGYADYSYMDDYTDEYGNALGSINVSANTTSLTLENNQDVTFIAASANDQPVTMSAKSVNGITQYEKMDESAQASAEPGTSAYWFEYQITDTNGNPIGETIYSNDIRFIFYPENMLLEPGDYIFKLTKQNLPEGIRFTLNDPFSVSENRWKSIALQLPEGIDFSESYSINATIIGSKENEYGGINTSTRTIHDINVDSIQMYVGVDYDRYDIFLTLVGYTASDRKALLVDKQTFTQEQFQALKTLQLSKDYVSGTIEIPQLHSDSSVVNHDYSLSIGTSSGIDYRDFLEGIGGIYANETVQLYSKPLELDFILNGTDLKSVGYDVRKTVNYTADNIAINFNEELEQLVPIQIKNGDQIVPFDSFVNFAGNYYSYRVTAIHHSTTTNPLQKIMITPGSAQFSIGMIKEEDNETPWRHSYTTDLLEDVGSGVDFSYIGEFTYDLGDWYQYTNNNSGSTYLHSYPVISSGDLDLEFVDVMRESLDQYNSLTSSQPFQNTREYTGDFYKRKEVRSTLMITNKATEEVVFKADNRYSLNFLYINDTFASGNYTLTYKLPIGHGEEIIMTKDFVVSNSEVAVTDHSIDGNTVTITGTAEANTSVTVQALKDNAWPAAASKTVTSTVNGQFIAELTLPEDGNYTIYAYKTGEDAANAASLQVLIDVTPPTKPQVNVNEFGLVEWDENEDAAYYEIEYGLKGSTLEKVDQQIIGNTFQLEDLEAAEIYQVKVIAYDEAGNSAASNIIEFTTAAFISASLDVTSDISDTDLFIIGKQLTIELKGSYSSQESYTAAAEVSYIEAGESKTAEVELSYDESDNVYAGSFQIAEGITAITAVKGWITKADGETSTNILTKVIDNNEETVDIKENRVGATLTGTVLRNGEPVEGAIVTLISTSHYLKAETDETGAFKFEGVKAADHAKLDVKADEEQFYNTVSSINLKYGETIVLAEAINLPVYKDVKVKLVDASTETAVSKQLDVDIIGIDQQNNRIKVYGYIGADGLFTTWSGQQQINHVMTGSYKVKIYGQGIYKETIQDITIQPDPNYLVTPIVLGVNKKTKETTDVTLRILTNDSELNQIDYYSLYSWDVASAFGYDVGSIHGFDQDITVTELVYEEQTVTGMVYGATITIPNVVLSDDYRLTVQVEGHHTTVPTDSIQFQAHLQNSIDVMVNSGLRLTGTLEDASGNPITYGSISAYSLTSSDYQSVNSDGFMLQGLASGETMNLYINVPDFMPKQIKVDAAATADQNLVDLGVIDLVRAKYIHGRILDGEANPVKGASVQVRGASYGSARTDGEGYFKVRGLSEGTNYTVEVSKYGYPSALKTGVSTSEDEMTISLVEEATGSFTGAGNSFAASNHTIVPGKTIQYRLNYKNNGSEAEENVTLQVNLPANITLIADSVMLNGTAQDVTGNTFTVTVPTVEAGASGSLTVEAKVNANTEEPVLANAKVNNGNALIATTNVLFVSLNAPEQTAQKQVKVYGKAKPGSVVQVFSGSVKVAEVQSDKRWWFADITLPLQDISAEAEFTLTAKVIDGSSTHLSNTVNVKYSPNIPTLNDVTISAGWNGDVKLNPYTGVATFAIVERTPLDTEVVFDQAVDEAYITFLGERHDLTKGSDDVTFTGGVPYGWSSYGEQLLEITFVKGDVEITLPLMEVIVLIDPSGYVFEGSMDNRLEGVTAVVEELMEETDTWSRWDAEFFGQVNPQTTDEDGRYGWDVIEGNWRVIFSKEGYEAYDSRIVVVPPAETQLNVPLVATTAPEVVSIDPADVSTNVETNASIKITFNRPMNEAEMNEHIKVYSVINGVEEAIIGSLELQGMTGYKEDISKGGGELADSNGETGWFIEDPSKQLSKEVVFNPEQALQSGTTYKVVINEALLDYADKPLGEGYVYTFETQAAAVVEGGGGGFFFPPAADTGMLVVDKAKLNSLVKGNVVEINLEENLDEVEFSIEVLKELGEKGYETKIKAGTAILSMPSDAIELEAGESLRIAIKEQDYNTTAGYMNAGQGIKLTIAKVKGNEEKAVVAKKALTLELDANTDDTSLVGFYEIKDGEPVYVGRKLAAATKQSGQFALLTYEHEFKDVNANHWASDDIKFLVSHHIADGVTAEAFKPSDNITRAQVAKMVADLMQLDTNKSSNTFKDVKDNAWYTGYIAAVEQAQIFQGSNGSFRPNDTITRQELAVVVAKLLEGKGTTELKFEDTASIAGWAKESVELAASYGIIVGNTKQEFEPQDQATRAETASMLRRLIQEIDKQ